MKHTIEEMKVTVEQRGGVTVHRIEPGRLVFCDICGDDWTDRPESGGLVFGSKACCPTCGPKVEADVKVYREEFYIRGRCPPRKSFADWVRDDLRRKA